MATFLRYCVAFISTILFALPAANSQIIYYSIVDVNNGQIYALDISTCTTSFVTNAEAYNDMAVGSGSTYYGLVGNSVYSINSDDGVSTFIANVSGLVTGLEVGPTGTIYVLGFNLYAVDPVTAGVTNLGPLPNSWLCVGDLVYLNGQFYATVQQPSGPDLLISVNIANPSLSTVVSSNLPGANLVAGAGVNDATCPKMYWFDLTGGNSIIWEYDVNTQTWTQKCSGTTLTAGGAGTPAGYSFSYSCGTCITDAGSLLPSPLEACVNTAITVPFNNNAVLDGNDLLRYILFSNLANPTGSLLAVSTTATIPYNPSYVPGQTYYVATMAGDNLNGNVNLSDPCFDISNLVAVTWRPRPTIMFTSPVSQLCSGQCETLTTSFTGTPPFTLTAEATYAGSGLGSFTQTFSTTTGAVSICVPQSPPSGSILVQATALTDAFCTCN